MNVLRFSKKYFENQKKHLFLYIFLSVIGVVISIVSPYVLGDFVDTLVAGAVTEDIVRFCYLFGIICVSKIIKDYWLTMISTKLQTKLSYSLNMDIIKHIQRIPLMEMAHTDDAYLNQRINGDVYTIISFDLTYISDMLTSIPLLIGALCVLYTINRFVLLVLGAFVVVYMTVYALMKEPIYKAGLACRESVAKFYSSLFEQLEFTEKIKIDATQEIFNGRAEKAFVRYFKTMIKSQRINYFNSGIDGIIATLAQMTLFAVGGLLVIRGQFSIGLFTVFSNYFKLMLGSVRTIFSLASLRQTTMASYDRINAILNIKEETNGDIKLSSIDAIDLRNVTFSYKENGSDDAATIKMFSHTFSKGNMYALVGRNGIGKTTLTKLLIGLYGAANGEIRYNGYPLETIDMCSARRSLIGYAEQTPLLIEDSIYYNLTYDEGGKNSDKDKLNEYVNILNMNSFIEKNGYSLKINRGGVNLSGGEKQRLGLVKTLNKGADFLVLDEPTSALDKETKGKLLKYLNELKKDRIILVVTHDSEVLSYCDEVVELMAS
ncbi:MAG: ABC transporter ATP-binding protein [Lachnospiraceae bacterium]|nr:ABC transporter ATP-binding protein [Lachnospiraceae bacterium]